jgi:mannose-1-phosphate guanylyltransferase
VTNVSQAQKIREIASGKILPQNVIEEPSARNTAACIGYAAVKIMVEHGDGVMIVSPSDAFIKDQNTYASILNLAVEKAKTTNSLITIGITPTFPATGYGYIQFENSEEKVKKVQRFVEKPDLETAKEYLSKGNYVWNSGVFVWKASVILEKFKSLIPDIYADLMQIKDAIGTDKEMQTVNRVYPNIRSISVDYGIMEKSSDILVIPGEFGWSDVGSWDMMGVLNEKDKDGNVLSGDTVCIDTKNCVVYSKKRLVATVGIENLVVVETDDAIMVCPIDKAQEVKKIVDKLKDSGRKDLL